MKSELKSMRKICWCILLQPPTSQSRFLSPAQDTNTGPSKCEVAMLNAWAPCSVMQCHCL